MAQYTGWLDGQAEAVFQNLDHFLDHATKKGLTVLVKPLKSLVPPARIELAAHGLGKPTSELSNLLKLHNLLNLIRMQILHFCNFSPF